MASVNIPQVVTEGKASGAQVIDGSLRFDSRNGNILSRTPGSAGNRKTWTYSVWVKRDNKGTGAASNHCCLFSADSGSANDNQRMHMFLGAGNQDYIQHDLHSSSPRRSNAAFRDLTGWYHVCISLDTTTGGNDSVYSQIQWWINGKAITDQQGGWSTQNALTEDGDYGVNGNWLHYLGCNGAAGPGQFWDGRMSQATLVDGQRVGPSYFGYTDPLTGQWRPRKFEAGESTPNDGRVWSTMLTTSSGSINNAGNAFNGKTDDFANSSATDPVFTFTPTGGIKYRDSVRIWLRTAQHKARLNGGAYKFNTGAPTGGYWLTLDEGNGGGTITTIDAQYTSSSLTAINAIEVDGVILKDSTTTTTAFGTNGFYLPFDGNSPIGEDKSGNGNHWKPQNFGGSASIEKATGAFPILNTNGGVQASPAVFGSNVSSTVTVTVSNATGNNKYYLDSVLNPSLAFIRGATITFDTTDSSNNSHPFKLSSTNADSSGGTEYTDGVKYFINGSSVSGSDYVSNYATNSGGTGFRGIKWTIPHNVSTTYYYCTSHTGMGNNGRLTSSTDIHKADPYAWKCTLAIPFIGKGVIDLSGDLNCTTTSKTLAADNLTAEDPGEVHRDMFYGKVTKFTGDGSNNSRVTISSGAFGFGTGDFTIEFWANFTAVGDQGNRNARILTPQSESGTYIQILTSTGNATIQLNNLDIPSNQVQNKTRHFVFQRTGTTGELIVDGVLVDSGTENRDFPDVAYQIGRYDSTNGGMSAYMSDFRAYNGIQKYSTTGKSVGDPIFIPASPDPDILPDSPSGVSNKIKLTKIDQGSVAFNGLEGTKTNLLVPDSTDLDFGTGAFTIECYLYLNSYGNTGSYPSFISEYSTPGGSASWILRAKNNGKVIWYDGNNNESSENPMVLGKWLHVAAVREGTGSNQMKVYVDGKLHITVTDATNYASGNGIAIGSQDTDNTNTIDGFISNVRILKGTALYTSEFVPPNGELTNITNTKLLCCQSNKYPGHYTVCPTPGGINDGDIWSDSTLTITTAGTTETGTLGAVFNATTGTTGAVDSFGYLNGAFDFTWTPRAAIPYTNKVEVWTGYGGNVSLNGGSDVSTANNNWTELVSGSSGNITSIRFTTGSGGGWWSGVRVDDVMLVDPIFTNGKARSSSFNPITSNIDTVRGQEGAYCTINALDPGSLTVTNGKLTYTRGSNDWESKLGTLFMTAGGKWYYEVFLNTAEAGNNNAIVEIGMALPTFTQYANYLGTDTNSWAYQNNGASYGQAFHNNVQVTNYGRNAVAGDTLALSLDLSKGGSNGVLTFYKNGISMGPAFTNIDCTKDYLPAFSAYAAGKGTCNFGQKPFRFPPPEGFQPISSLTQRPDTVVALPSKVVGTTLYTGDDVDGRQIKLGHEADLVWVKGRNAAAGHLWQDTVRGPGQTVLATHSSALQTTETYGQISEFTKSGITVTSGSTGDENINYPDRTYVAWSWTAGGSKSTFNIDGAGHTTAAAAGLAASGNSWDSDPTGASIGTRQGFSIIKHSGTGSTGSLPHGLTQKPDMLITKAYGGTTGNWNVYTDLIDGSYDYMYFNDNAHKGDSSLSAFTSELFYYGYTTNDYIHYLWHSVPGLQKFGTFTGNSGVNFVQLDFKPAIIWVKRAIANSSSDTSTTNSAWTIMDSARIPFNGLTPNHLFSDWTAAEGKRGDGSGTSSLSDMTLESVANGFYLNGPASETNSNTGTFFYAAWAEEPQSNLFGASSTAR